MYFNCTGVCVNYMIINFILIYQHIYSERQIRNPWLILTLERVSVSFISSEDNMFESKPGFRYDAV